MSTVTTQRGREVSLTDFRNAQKCGKALSMGEWQHAVVEHEQRERLQLCVEKAARCRGGFLGALAMGTSGT
jgi:hypothetical protein